MSAKDTPQESVRSAKAERTRSVVLAAARRVFSEHGFDDALTSEIARQAECAEGTVFLHFKNKRGLLLALMLEFYDSLLHATEQLVSEQRASKVLLVQMTHLYLRELETNWSVVKLFASRARLADDDFSEGFYRRNRRLTRLFVDVFEQLKNDRVFRSDVDTRCLRDMLFGAVEHYTLTEFGKGIGRDRDAFVTQTLDVLFVGAAQSTPVGTTEDKLDRILALLQEDRPPEPMGGSK